MSEEDPPEPVRPMRSFLEGAGIPGAIILTCALIGAAYAFWQWGPQYEAIVQATKYGAVAGFFLTLLTSWELVLMSLFESGPIQNKLARTAGLALVLTGLVYGLVWGFAL